jgi:hypothetical protein
MPLDHYVSQVHLRNFYSPSLRGQKMYGFRKRDGHVFQCSSKDVCRVENGSTNSYLLEDRAIETFLTTIEPRYNDAVNQLRTGCPSRDAIYVIAGFVAYVTACSPTALRLGAEPLRKAIEATTAILDSKGELPQAPEELGSASTSQLLRDGTIKVNVDQKYPQAIGISAILNFVGVFGNSMWELVQNNEPLGPFFTSDFPAAIEPSAGQTLGRVVPLAPDFAVRILTDRTANDARLDTTFPTFRPRAVVAKAAIIREINQSIVRSAEELIFFRDDHDWVRAFLTKNARFRIEVTTQKVAFGRGFSNVSSMGVAPTQTS